MITAMLAAAVPLATPLAQTGGAANTNGVAATAHAKSDDAAAREFAALLGSMLPAPVTPLAPAPVRVELESLADAGIDAESDDATTDELGRADGGMLEESGESLHRHGVASMPILIDDAPPEDSVPLKRATGVERPEADLRPLGDLDGDGLGDVESLHFDRPSATGPRGAVTFFGAPGGFREDRCALRP